MVGQVLADVATIMTALYMAVSTTMVIIIGMAVIVLVAATTSSIIIKVVTSTTMVVHAAMVVQAGFGTRANSILKKLTFTLRLIFTVENIVPGATVVVGGDGYTLTQEDIDKLQIELPEGYEWHYDGACGCITIIQTTGIANAGSDQTTVKQTYDATGRQVGEGSKGVNIQRMNDGTVRKVTTK